MQQDYADIKSVGSLQSAVGSKEQRPNRQSAMFMIGQTVSHYRILSELGRGAMSVVYLGRDERLKRYVAIKMLNKEHHARSSQQGSRLLREARAISQINHPNIATIYDYGETDDGQSFIVMEYVEGETLGEVLKRKTLSVSRSVEIVASVAAALLEAHSKGIIHRDIKPSNIIINKRGEVKVLDFGLAKHIEGFSPAELSATMQGSAETQTREGIVVGTPLYLSPEQALGDTIDQRTDIFSLGSVLYECLTGRHPFQAPSVIEICAKILRDEPLPPSQLNSDVSSALDEITFKALAKDPQKRYQTAKELREALGFAHKETAEEISHSPKDSKPNDVEPMTASGGPTTTKGETPANTAEESAKARSFFSKTLSTSFLSNVSPVGKATIASLVFILTCTIGYLGYRMFAKKTSIATNQFSQKEIALPGDAVEAAISPDGQLVASVVNGSEGQSIYITQLSTNGYSEIVKPSKKGYAGLTFSPNGSYIYYVERETESATLYRVTQFGNVQKLLPNVNTAVSFSPDGSHITFVRQDFEQRTTHLMTAKEDGSDAKIITSRGRPEWFSIDAAHAGPIWHPKEQVIVCPTYRKINGKREFNFEAVNLNDLSSKRINTKPWERVIRTAWLNDGSGFVITGIDELMSNPKLAVVSYPDGQIKKLFDSTDIFTQASLTKDNASLLTIKSSVTSNIWLIPFPSDDASQAKLIKSNLAQAVSSLSFLPNKQLIYSMSSGGKQIFWRDKLDGKPSEPLIAGDSISYSPTISVDGRYVVFVSYRGGSQNIWSANIDGTGVKQITSGNYEDMPQITPDNQWVIYHSNNGLWKISFSGGTPSSLLPKNAIHPAISPDGKFLACFTLERELDAMWKIEVFSLGDMSFVKSFPLQRQADVIKGLLWTPDSKGLTYLSEENNAYNVWLQPFDKGEPQQITHFNDQTIFSFAWSPDGKQIACSRGTETNKAVLITNLPN
jgi:serine/threonine protein kinase